ncbi:hypothetical protein CB1_001221017 [Camelus ferus]|nr:hypothetical protein CB1_001221017 [Camelus ferus]
MKEELEHLNQASEEINQVELQLDEARTTYRRILQESARKLNTQGSHLGSCIEKARPYYEARRLAKEAQQETQKAALRYERAVSMHNAAREMVFVAEQGVMADKNRLDPTWQEMLNHATCKDGDSGIIEGAEGGGLEEGVSLGPGPARDTDTLSLLSLRTVASDLQKCDSVEHLRGLSDHTSLDGQELGPRGGGRRGSDGAGRGGRHQRSVSL